MTVEEAAEAVVASRRAVTAATRAEQRKLAEEAHRLALGKLRTALVAERSRAPLLGDAAEWLEEYLTGKGGSGELQEIKAAGHKARHSEDSLRNAREQLKLVTERRGYPSRIWWWLPGAAALQDRPAATFGGVGQADG